MTITQKLTLKNLRMNKTRTIVTIIGIILSVALITVVAGIYTSFNQSMIDMAVHNTGDYDLLLMGSQTSKAMEYLQEHPDVQDVYTEKVVGLAKMEKGSYYTPYACVLALSPNTFTSGFDFTLKEGAYPQNSDEIAVTPQFLRSCGTNYKVGDKLTLELGIRTMLPDSTEYIEIISGPPLSEYEIPPMTYYLAENEVFSPKATKTYTITGIVNDVSGTLADDPFSACLNIYTVGSLQDKTLFEMTDASDTYIRFTDAAEKDYQHAFGSLFGLSQEQTDRLFSDQPLSEQESMQLFAAMAKTGLNASNYQLNISVLSAKGANPDPQSTLMMIALIGFIFLLIVAASVFIIRNSFAISITEKTKLYGMLASTGATSRQIRHNVMFEGFVLGLIGIPLGLLLGVGVTAGLVALVNGMMGEFIGNMRFVFMVPFWAMLVAVGLGVLTIFFSVYSSAVRASKISPIEAIRSNTDIKISGKKKPKKFKTPRLIENLFGAGGSIAWKNMKRSRKQYRTTVISIIVSVAVYISIYSFVEYNFAMITAQFGTQEYNMSLEVYQYDNEGNDLPFAEKMKLYDKLRHLDGVEKSVLSTDLTDYTFEIMVDHINPEALQDAGGGDYRNYWIKCVAVDDEKFNALAGQFGVSPEETKNKAFLYNTTRVFLNDEGSYKDVRLLQDYQNLTITGQVDFEPWYDYEEYEAEGKEPPASEHKSVKLTIIDELPKDFSYAAQSYINYEEYLVISMDTFREMLPSFDDYSYRLTMSLYSDNCDTLEDELSNLAQSDKNYSGMNVYNYSKQMREINAVMLLVQIFVYGFIIVIVLIGMTNIFNTITTNMKMRRKEFAMLQSIGMTKREFNRMISLESLLYTTKSLLIGLPIGIAASILIHLLFNKIAPIHRSYVFPWVAVLLSISVVMILVWVIMRFSIKKVHKQNIIETIRNDNI